MVRDWVAGLKLDKEGGTWIQTPVPSASDSAIQRKAQLKLADTGDLEGKVVITYTGLEASQRRLQERLADDTERKKYLEDEVKEAVPVACEVELTNQPDWKSSSPSFVAEFSLKVPGWVAGAGRRALMPVGLFSAPEKRLFDHADRVHPIPIYHPDQRRGTGVRPSAKATARTVLTREGSLQQPKTCRLCAGQRPSGP